MGLDYLTGMEPPKDGYAGGGRVNFQKGSVPKMLEHLINKLVEEKKFSKALLEKANPKDIQELCIQQFGKLPSAEEVKDIVDDTVARESITMESINGATTER
jgi:hypothetical protein